MNDDNGCAALFESGHWREFLYFVAGRYVT